jgi:hypothetical protein
MKTNNSATVNTAQHLDISGSVTVNCSASKTSNTTSTFFLLQCKHHIIHQVIISDFFYDFWIDVINNEFF